MCRNFSSILLNGLRDYGVENQLGLESTPAEYVAKLVRIFQEVRRVLRADGTLWLNLGDSYTSGKAGRTDRDSNTLNIGNRRKYTGPIIPRSKPDGYKSKNLLGIPWRVAFALQDDGWYLRQDIIYSKPNPMPESVTDRCTKAHEYIFLMTKQAKYFYDAEAIKEEFADKRAGNPGGGGRYAKDCPWIGTGKQTGLSKGEWNLNGNHSGRNKRSVWTITTKPYSEAHFATFPPELPEICIKAGCPEKVCEECGAAWVRVLERTGKILSTGGSVNSRRIGHTNFKDGSYMNCGAFTQHESKTTGFKSSCKCNAGKKPGIVLDPFSGAATAGLIAARLNRDFIGIEINPDYVKLSKKRIYNDAPLFNKFEEVL